MSRRPNPLSMLASVHVLGGVISLVDEPNPVILDPPRGCACAAQASNFACFSARGPPNFLANFQRQLLPPSPLLITHHQLYHGIASLYFRLLDVYRLAIRIAESGLCSQPRYLFVCDRIVRSGRPLATHYQRRGRVFRYTYPNHLEKTHADLTDA